MTLYTNIYRPKKLYGPGFKHISTEEYKQLLKDKRKQDI